MDSNSTPDPVPESDAALWLAVGRLQSDVAWLTESQATFRREYRAGQAETNRLLDSLNRKIDRAFYAIIGAGASARWPPSCYRADSPAGLAPAASRETTQNKLKCRITNAQ